MLPERLQLPRGDLIGLDLVLFCEEGAHDFDKAARYS
jgi:hypothetical protein